MISSSRCIAAAVAGVIIGSGGLLAAQPDTQAETQAQEIQQLKEQVARLEAKSAENSKDVAVTIDKVLRDAEQRSQLMAMGGGTAGYDNGFFIASEDRSFFFHPGLQFQPRFITTWRDGAKDSGNDDTQSGFEVRRIKLGFDGNIFSKDLTYNFLWATGRADGLLKLEEAWAKYNISDQLGVRVGQFKDPVAHEGLVSSKKLLAVERSYLQDVIGLGDNFVQGVTAILNEQGPVRAEVGFTDGMKSANTNFQDPPTNAADFGVAGRVEWAAMGDFKPYGDMTAMGTKQDMLVLGAGGDWTQSGDIDIILHTVDVQYENAAGLGLYAAFLGRSSQNAAFDGGDLYDWGFLVQGSYMFDQNWEAFARYDFTDFDKDALASDSENEVHEITIGVNYYFHGHNAKFTVDVGWLPNGAVISDDGSGILANDGRDEVLVRTQLQLLI